MVYRRACGETASCSPGTSGTLLMPLPSPDAGLTPVNINYVWDLSDRIVQSWMPAWAWLVCLVVGLPTILFLPTHRVLRRLPAAPTVTDEYGSI